MRYCQHQQPVWHPWQCVSSRNGLLQHIFTKYQQRPGQLCRSKVRYHWSHENKCEGVGSSLRRPSQHVRNPFTQSFSSANSYFRVAFGPVETRLTQGKETGAAITMADGSKINLGIPGATEKSKAGNRYTSVPLQKAASPTEAASSILAVASPLFAFVTGQTIEVISTPNGKVGSFRCSFSVTICF